MSEEKSASRSLRAKPKQKENFDPSPSEKTSPKRRNSMGTKKTSTTPIKKIVDDPEVCPTTICLERDTKNWIGCDKCPQWFHLDCAQNISKITINQDEDWSCPKCKPEDFNHPDINEMLPALLKKFSSTPSTPKTPTSEENVRNIKTRKVEQNPSNTTSTSSIPSSYNSPHANMPPTYAKTSFPPATGAAPRADAYKMNPSSLGNYPQMGPKNTSGNPNLTPMSQPSYPYRFTPIPGPLSSGTVIPPPPTALSQPNLEKVANPSQPVNPPQTLTANNNQNNNQNNSNNSNNANANPQNVNPPSSSSTQQNNNQHTNVPDSSNTVDQPPSSSTQPPSSSTQPPSSNDQQSNQNN